MDPLTPRLSGHLTQSIILGEDPFQFIGLTGLGSFLSSAVDLPITFAVEGLILPVVSSGLTSWLLSLVLCLCTNCASSIFSCVPSLGESHLCQQPLLTSGGMPAGQWELSSVAHGPMWLHWVGSETIFLQEAGYAGLVTMPLSQSPSVSFPMGSGQVGQLDS